MEVINQTVKTIKSLRKRLEIAKPFGAQDSNSYTERKKQYSMLLLELKDAADALSKQASIELDVCRDLGYYDHNDVIAHYESKMNH